MENDAKPADEPGDGSTAERATDDHASQTRLTEEDMPSPEEREDAAHDLELDPI